MAELVVVTGGARSGKSTFAEKSAKAYGNEILYIATSIPFDDEMKDRIKKHRESRPSNWDTVEAYKELDSVLYGRIEGKSAVLLDCITIMVTNLMLETDLNWESLDMESISSLEANVNIEIKKLLTIVKRSSIPFILVTNEVGMGLVPENKLGRAFRDIAGRVNQMLAEAADEVYFCVSGIPVRIK